MLVYVYMVLDKRIVYQAMRNQNPRTQLRLKQSCEQKKLSLMSSFRHVGHCKLPACSLQSTPMHLRFVGGSEVIAGKKTFTFWPSNVSLVTRLSSYMYLPIPSLGS